MSFNKNFKRVISLVSLGLVVMVGGVYGCSDNTTQPENPVIAPENEGFSYQIVAQQTTLADTILKIRVSWKAPNDPFGAPDFYRHTMTATKVVTDAVTGPLPSLKVVNGIADTVSIKLNLVNDTVTLTSNVWSVRRNLQSTSPAVGKLFVRRGDRAPLPPDSIRVDTIYVGGAVPIIGSKESIKILPNTTSLEVNNQRSFNSLFTKQVNGATTYKVGNTTYLTLSM
jgi:hypothetical protein